MLRDSPEGGPTAFYQENVMEPLALGQGVACFLAQPLPDEDDPNPWLVSANHEPHELRSTDEDYAVRVREMVRCQVGARAVANMTHGLVPVVD